VCCATHRVGSVDCGRELGAAFVLSRIRRAADRIRVTVQLLTCGRTSVWAGHLMNALPVLSLKSDSSSVAEALFPFNRDERVRLANCDRQSSSSRAYLRGRFYWNFHRRRFARPCLLSPGNSARPDYAVASRWRGRVLQRLGVFSVLRCGVRGGAHDQLLTACADSTLLSTAAWPAILVVICLG